MEVHACASAVAAAAVAQQHGSGQARDLSNHQIPTFVVKNHAVMKGVTSYQLWHPLCRHSCGTSPYEGGLTQASAQCFGGQDHHSKQVPSTRTTDAVTNRGCAGDKRGDKCDHATGEGWTTLVSTWGGVQV